MRHRIVALWLAAALQAVVSAAAAEPTTNTDPERARLIHEDVPRFWRAYDAAAEAETPAARAAIYRDDYLAPGTPGLAEFLRLRIGSAEQLAATVQAHPVHFANLRAQTRDLDRHAPPIRAAMRELARIYPEAVFPDVYLLVGRMNSGGTLTDTGLLIGLEMHGRLAGADERELSAWHRAVIAPMDALPYVVAHELIHYQQRYAQDGRDTLLAAALNEGVADFVAERIAGRHINHHLATYAEPRSEALWAEFAAARKQREYGPWLYDSAPADGRPADLGYWIGYRIADAYYRRSADKAAAIRDMLRIQDYEDFLLRSGFDGRPRASAARAP